MVLGGFVLGDEATDVHRERLGAGQMLPDGRPGFDPPPIEVDEPEHDQKTEKA